MSHPNPNFKLKKSGNIFYYIHWIFPKKRLPLVWFFSRYIQQQRQLISAKTGQLTFFRIWIDCNKNHVMTICGCIAWNKGQKGKRTTNSEATLFIKSVFFFNFFLTFRLHGLLQRNIFKNC